MRSQVQFAFACHPSENPLIQHVLEYAKSHSVFLYIVGGYIRDGLNPLGYLPGTESLSIQSCFDELKKRDVDFAVAGSSAFLFAKNFSDRFSGHFVPLDEANDTARVVLDDGSILDFAGCVGDGTIETDLKRRDFTVNALAWDPAFPDQVIDLFGGIQDLKNKIIRAVSKQSFVDDPLRILRTFRFANQLNADIDSTTLVWARELVDGLKTIAPERINYELFESLSGQRAGKLTNQLAETGVLEAIFPELVETRRVTPNSYHHLGLFEHSTITVTELDARMNEFPAWMHESAARDLSYGVSRLAATRLACVLHDIGKPGTWEITPEGRHTFVAHDKLGAEMSVVIGDRMRWSRPVERLITRLIEFHLRPGQLFHQGAPTARALNRFYRAVGDDFAELMMVAYADLGATRGEGLCGANRDNLEGGFESLISGYRQFVTEIEQQKPLLSGHDIMVLLELPSGPRVGEILKALEEARDLKEVESKSQAEAFVRNFHAQKYSK